MARIQTYVTVDGIDVTSKVMGWNFVDTFGDEIPDMVIKFSKSVLGLVTAASGAEVIVKRGPVTGQEYNVFKGDIDTVQKNIGQIIIKAKDKLIALVRTNVNTSFDKDIDVEAGVGSAIANTLITSAAFGGLSTNSGATVVSTGATVLLEKFVCRKTDVFERVKTIADIYDYQIYYNYDDDFVYFEPTGYTANANTLTVGTNVSNLPVWEFDNTQLVNKIRVEGAEQIVETTESGQIGVTSGYTVSDVLLTKQPFSTKVFCDSANPPTTLRIGGTLGATGTFDYYVDEQNKKIIWNSTYTPGGSDFVEVRYGYPSPIPVLRNRATSITLYGLSATTKHFSDIRTVEDAINRGDLFLDLYSQPFVRTKLHVPSIANNYRAGETVSIVDNVNGETRDLVINKIVKKFPHKYDIIHVGNKEYKMAEYNRFTLDRIKRLEEELSKNDDILIQIIDVSRTFKPRRRYLKLQKEVIADTNSLIWDHPTQGQWNDEPGSNDEEWGGTAFGSTTVQKLVQGGMVYEEYCYDTDFHDATSTATFSTITQNISFTAGQVWSSTVIDLGTTLSQIKVDLGTVVGTLLIEISSDNAVTWQTVTEGALTAVTSSNGTGTFIRITENAAGVATIDLTQDSFGQNTESVIKVLMVE